MKSVESHRDWRLVSRKREEGRGPPNELNDTLLERKGKRVVFGVRKKIPLVDMRRLQGIFKFMLFVTSPRHDINETSRIVKDHR